MASYASTRREMVAELRPGPPALVARSIRIGSKFDVRIQLQLEAAA